MTSRSSLVELGVRTGLPDLATGLDACVEILIEGKEGRTCWKLRRWAMALIRYVSRKPTVEDQMSAAKSYFARCREFAITSEKKGWGDLPPVPLVSGSDRISRRKLLHQVSRVSRSLRTATTKVVTDSLEAHWSLAQSRFETPGHLRRSWKLFLRRHFSADVVASFTGVGSAASFLRTKHAGGSASEIREITDDFRAKELTLPELQELASGLPGFIKELVTKVADFTGILPKLKVNRKTRLEGWLPRYRVDTVFFLYDRESELSLEDWEVARETLFSLAACWYAIDFSALPRCRQVAVNERGFKVRVATPLEAPFRYLLSVINVALLKKLEEDPRTVSALHGCPAEELDWTLGRRTNLVFSADLKSATDYFPQDLMRDAADTLSEGWPEELRSLFFRAVGPHTLYRPKGNESCVTSRGILMGSPVSWPLLSMYSAWLHSESGSDGWFAVCGDDYVGCHTYPTYVRYLSARTATGAVGSPGKDILGRDSVGVFAEELISVGRGRCIPTVSVRAVLGDPKSGLPAWQQGPEVTQALTRLYPDRAVCMRICSKLHSVQIAQLRRVHIDPFSPRWVGGAGFPGIPTQKSLVRARRLMSQSPTQITTWVTGMEMAWTTHCSSSILTSAVLEDVNKHIEFRWDTGRIGEWGPLKDVVSSRLGSLSWPYFLAGAATRELRVSLRSVSARILSIDGEITSRGYWVSPSEKVVCGKRLVDALEALEPQAKPIPFPPIVKSLSLRGTAGEFFLVRKTPSGPGHPNWGSRKRARLD